MLLCTGWSLRSSNNACRQQMNKLRLLLQHAQPAMQQQQWWSLLLGRSCSALFCSRQ
jgi:hypothetical protein